MKTMIDNLPPIAGKGTEQFTLLPSKYGWCGECGYTGRVAGPRQLTCHAFIWHAHLQRQFDLLDGSVRP